MIQQQDAAVASPAGIRAAIPEQGRVLTFKRAVEVNTKADLRIELQAKVARAASLSLRFVMLTGILVAIALTFSLTRRSRRASVA
jgi:hypothetical protein